MSASTGHPSADAEPGIGRALDRIRQRATTAAALWAADMAIGTVSSILLLGGDGFRMDTDENHHRRCTELAHDLNGLTVAGTYCADNETDYYQEQP